STLDRLLISERMARRTAFAADLDLAGRELAAGHVEIAQTLLRRHQTAEDQDDLRDFTWHYLMHQATRIYTVNPLRDLQWWRGEKPSAQIFASLDPRSRLRLTHALAGLSFDLDGIRTWHWQPGTSQYLGDRYRSFSCSDDRGNILPHLLFDDGRQPVS